jgi:hypothetical protein
MRLLTAHKILISAALLLAVVLASWGVAHGLRGDRGAWGVAALGVALIPTAGLYLRKLRRNPPLK